MENEMCSICQEDLIGISNILTTKCNHKFHTDCYMKYINSSHKNCCPICRQNIIEENLDAEYNLFIENETSIIFEEIALQLGIILFNRIRNENISVNSSIFEITNECANEDLNIEELFSIVDENKIIEISYKLEHR